MLTREEREYYSRQMQLPGWGTEAQQRLKSARVLVIGAGALGCTILQNLVRTGVGFIKVIDNDFVSSSNLQRQILFDINDIRKKKAQTAAKKAAAINPHVTIESEDNIVDQSNVTALISSYDVIVDGSDNFKTKYLLNDACVTGGKPLVFGAIEGFQGQVAVFNYKDGPTYRCIFPEAPLSGETADCNTIGVTSVLPQLIGSLQANEAIKIICGLGEVLSGKMILFDALSNSFSSVMFTLNPENKKITLPVAVPEMSCAVNPEAVPINIAAVTDEFLLVDVRDEGEHAVSNIGGLNIPLYAIDEAVDDLPDNKKIVTYCRSGSKAKQAAMLISSRKKTKVYYLDSPLDSVIRS